MKDLRDIIREVKDTHSCTDFLNNTLNISVPYSGKTIRTPDFIRHGDKHPSFTVYDNLCIDHATGLHYDIISLAQIALFNGSFSEALQFLYGQKIWGSQPHSFDTTRNLNQQKLDDQIYSWHHNLLNHPDIIKNFCYSRGFSDDFIRHFSLGYDDQSQRIIFPFTKNNHFCFYAGRDISGKSTKKYLYPRLADNPVYEKNAWGMLSLRYGKTLKHTYIADDGQEYDTGEIDPRDTTLCILEGLPDAASFIIDGWQALSPGGGEFSSATLQSILSIAKSYKHVFICFDNDGPGINFQRKLARALFNAQIDFCCGHVPHEVNGQHCKDVNEYFCAGGSIENLVKSATPGLHELAQNEHDISGIADIFHKAAFWCSVESLFQLKTFCMNIPSDDINPVTKIPYAKYSHKLINLMFAQSMKPVPEAVAAELVEKKHTIRYDISGAFYEYKNGIWQETPEVIVQKYVGEALGQKASSNRMASIARHIKMKNAGTMKFNEKNVVCFPNGTLHLDERECPFRRHSQDDMCTHVLPYMYDPDARALKWEKFIYDICGGDPEKMLLMQQIAGYIMCPNNKYQKLFYFIGDGRNGKSVFANILEQVYGPENCSSVPASRLGTQFDPIALKNSLLNVTYEAKSILNGSEETIKAVASGDPIMAAHKGVDAVSFKTRAKLIVLANKLWRSQDVSYGFLRRILFVKFDKQYIGSADNKNLYSELLRELPGIFNWCYEGYQMLKANGGFQEIDDQAQVMSELMDMMSPVSAFVNEELLSRKFIDRLSRGAISEKEVYALYRTWCDEGNFRQLDRIEFMKDMGLLLRQRNLGIKIESDGHAKYKAFVLADFPEMEKMAAEDEEDRASTKSPVIALGSATPSRTPETAASTDTQSESVAEAKNDVPEGTGKTFNSDVAAGESAITTHNINGQAAGVPGAQIRDTDHLSYGYPAHSSSYAPTTDIEHKQASHERDCLLSNSVVDDDPAAESEHVAGSRPTPKKKEKPLDIYRALDIYHGTGGRPEKLLVMTAEQWDKAKEYFDLQAGNMDIVYDEDRAKSEKNYSSCYYSRRNFYREYLKYRPRLGNWVVSLDRFMNLLADYLAYTDPTMNSQPHKVLEHFTLSDWEALKYYYMTLDHRSDAEEIRTFSDWYRHFGNLPIGGGYPAK